MRGDDRRWLRRAHGRSAVLWQDHWTLAQASARAPELAHGIPFSFLTEHGLQTKLRCGNRWSKSCHTPARRRPRQIPVTQPPVGRFYSGKPPGSPYSSNRDPSRVTFQGYPTLRGPGMTLNPIARPITLGAVDWFTNPRTRYSTFRASPRQKTAKVEPGTHPPSRRRGPWRLHRQNLMCASGLPA